MNRIFVRLVAISACCVSGAAAIGAASTYDFLAAPETDLNRVYRLDKATGEIGACQYGLKEGTIGVTLCYPPGEGANAQAQSEYGLVASRHDREGPACGLEPVERGDDAGKQMALLGDARLVMDEKIIE